MMHEMNGGRSMMLWAGENSIVCNRGKEGLVIRLDCKFLVDYSNVYALFMKPEVRLLKGCGSHFLCFGS